VKLSIGGNCERSGTSGAAAGNDGQGWAHDALESRFRDPGEMFGEHAAICEFGGSAAPTDAKDPAMADMLHVCGGDFVYRNGQQGSESRIENPDLLGADEKLNGSGAFVGGATIELSCDAPLREPFEVYVQGGMIAEHAMLGALFAAKAVQE